MRFLFFFLFAFLGQATSAWAVMEIGGNFGYDRQIYGANREAKMVTRTYSGYVAWYVFPVTALEANYSQSEDILTQSMNITVDTTNNIKQVGLYNEAYTEVWGVGIRQMLSGKDSFLRPLISVGYAKQFRKSFTDYDYTINGAPIRLSQRDPNTNDDSIFAAFILQIYFTKTLSINGSVKTVFPAFYTGDIDRNLKYLAGLSWMF